MGVGQYGIDMSDGRCDCFDVVNAMDGADPMCVRRRASKDYGRNHIICATAAVQKAVIAVHGGCVKLTRIGDVTRQTSSRPKDPSRL